MNRRIWLLLFLLCYGTAFAQYYPPISVVAQNPSGQFINVAADSSNNMFTNGTGSGTTATAIAGYVPPAAMTAQGPNGTSVYLKADANGNLYVNCSTGCGGGGAGTTTNPITFNNTGSGVASGTTFNGASAVTVSYNSIGAAAVSVVTAATQYELPIYASAGSVAALTGSANLITDAAGDMIVNTPVASAVANSPALQICGVYEVTAGPTYAKDCWSLSSAINPGVNGASVISLTHSAGTSGFLQVTINGLVQASNFGTSGTVQSNTYQSEGGATTSTAFTGGQDGSNAGATEGNGTVRGGNNSSSTGTAGNGIVAAGAASNAAGVQGFAQVQQSFRTASALGATFEVVAPTTTGDQVAAATAGNTYTNIGVAQTVGGTNAQLYVVTNGKTTTRFDGTPVIKDIACTPPTSTGTTGLAHDNGTAQCPPGQALGIITGQVSGSGSGATATVLLQNGSNQVTTGTGGYIAYYGVTGTVISYDSLLDDSVTTANTLTYAGTGGISAKAIVTTGAGAGILGAYNAAQTAYTAWSSAATTTNTINGFATTPTSGDLVNCISSGTTCTFTDTNIQASQVTTASNTQVLSNKSATGPLVVTGMLDGAIPVVVTNATSYNLGAATSTGYTFNEEATAATAVTYTLPTAAAGLQYCVSNAWNGTAANTGVLELLTSASGQFIIFTDGTLSATGGNVTSGGAAADAACVIGVDSTHWLLYVNRGTWTKH